MQFNNPFFIILFAVFFLLYWLFSWRVQNLLLVLASYAFYALWGWPAAIILLGVSLTAFMAGVGIERMKPRCLRLTVVVASLTALFLLLFYAKYGQFIGVGVNAIFSLFSNERQFDVFQILIFTGVSFFVLRGAGYILDVYWGRIYVTTDLVSFLAYISFFPQLLSGPIERASSLLPKLQNSRHLDREQAIDAVGQFIWGFFKKSVIADGMAIYIGQYYRDPSYSQGWELAAGTYMFAVQLYCDFSGYSDMALGLGRLLGFRGVSNFATPYFSQSVGEFWSRWHITLVSWFRDYVYVPMGGNRCGIGRKWINVMVVFGLSGLWHGTGWNYLWWGLINGMIFLAFSWMERDKTARVSTPAGEAMIPGVLSFGRMVVVFHLILFTWIFFRAGSAGDAFTIIGRITKAPIGPLSFYSGLVIPIGLTVFLFSLEWLQRRKEHVLSLGTWPVPLQWLTYLATTFLVACFGNFTHVPFIYFKF